MIYLGFGSNMGDRRENFRQAVLQLQKKGVIFHAFSRLYTTPPWGILEQEAFLNGVAAVEDPAKNPENLMKTILETEQEMGRDRVLKWGPRLIDIDILDYNEMIWQTDLLTLPHPWLHKRSFVLKPLADLAPDWKPTGKEKTVAEFLAEFSEEELAAIEPLIDDPASPIFW